MSYRLNRFTRQLMSFVLLYAVVGQVFAVEEATGGPENFVSISDPIVVNVLSSDQLHFLRFTTQFQLTDPNNADKVKLHMAPLKDALILYLSEKKYFEVTTVHGKQKLRDEALARVRKVMTDLTGDPTIERIFFTSLIVQ